MFEGSVAQLCDQHESRHTHHTHIGARERRHMQDTVRSEQVSRGAQEHHPSPKAATNQPTENYATTTTTATATATNATATTTSIATTSIAATATAAAKGSLPFLNI